MRLCRDRCFVGAIDRLCVRPEEAVVLVHFAGLRGAESYIVAEFHIVCLDSDHRGRQHLLAIHDDSVAKNAVGSAELGLHSSIRAGDGDRAGSARLAGEQGNWRRDRREQDKDCAPGLHHVHAKVIFRAAA